MTLIGYGKDWLVQYYDNTENLHHGQISLPRSTGTCPIVVNDELPGWVATSITF